MSKRSTYTIKRSEHEEQCAVIDWRDRHPNIPGLYLLHAIPNGGKRNIITAIKLKQEGVVKGIPDLCLPVPTQHYHGLYIEMKSSTGTVSPDQKKIGKALMEFGYKLQVCYSADEAITTIKDYLGLLAQSASVQASIS